MKKVNVLLASITFALIMSTSAMAIDILSFNDSNLGWIDTTTWDWNVGNALAVDSVPLPLYPDQSAFEIYYQSDLSAFNGVNGTAITNTGLGTDYEITIQAGFGELGSRLDLGVSNIATFNLDPNSQVNFFNIYYDETIDANHLAGTGFNDGVMLMSGFVDSSTGTFSVTIDSNGDQQLDYTLLDNYLANDYPDIYTLSGVGATSVGAIVDYANINSTYIDTSGMDVDWYLDLFFNSSTLTPFNQQNPAAEVYGITPEFGSYYDGTDWIKVNGYFGTTPDPVDFLFQADGNSSVTVVPEPSTLLLLGAGLAGLGFYRRRRK